MNSMSQAGWLIAPFVAGFLMEIEFTSGIFMVALLSAAIASIAMRGLRGSSEVLELRFEEPLSRALSRTIRLGWMIMLSELLCGLAVGFFQPSASVFLNEVLMGSYDEVGAIFTIAGLAMLIAQYPGGLLIDRFGGHAVYAFSAFASAIPLILFSQSNFLIEAAFIMTIYYFITGFRWISGDGMLAQHYPRELRTIAMGVTWALWRAGFAVGSISCGIVWELMGIRFTFVIAFMLLLIASMVAFRVLYAWRRGFRGTV